MAQFGTVEFGTIGFAEEPVTDTVVLVPTGSLTFTGIAPDVTDISVPTGSMAFTGLVPNPFIGIGVTVPTGAVTFTGLAPAVVINNIFIVPTGSMVFTGYPPAYAEAPEILVPTGSMAFTGYAPTLRYRIPFRTVYNLRNQLSHRIQYALQERVSTTHRILYDVDANNTVQKTHRIQYGLPFSISHRIQYALQEVVSLTHRIEYGLTSEVRKTHRVAYDILSVDAVRRTHRMRYSLVDSSIINVTGSTVAVLEVSPGVFRTIGLESCRIFKDENDLHWTCSVSLTSVDDYALFTQDDPFTVSLFGEEWEFIVDSKELTRDSPAGWEARLQGVSPTALDDLPRSLELTQEYPDDITARDAVEGALSIAVDWQLVDWVIPAGRLSADRASPVDFAHRIVEAAGGVLESKKDGTWLARHLYPISPLWYDSATPDHVFSEQQNIFTASEQFVPGRVVNRIRITDIEANYQDVIEFIEDDVNPLRGDLYVYPSPFRTTVQLLSTALPADITLTPTLPTVQTRTVEDADTELGELVEFLNCEATTRYPIYAIEEVVWVGIDLGAVTFEEGSTTLMVSGSQGYSLARVKYTTQFIRYEVQAAEPIDAQFILEDIG